MHTAITALVERMMRSEELLIVGLGDSLTYGWDVERGFFDRFVDILSGRYPDARIRCHNAGIPGDTADGGLARLGRVLDLPAAVILVTSCALEREHDAAIVRPFYDAIIRVGAQLSVPVARLDRFWSTSALSKSGAALHNDDGVHPNDQGYALMAEGLLELFENDA
jgi:lysophospholipase L1-like esterase